MTAQFTEVNGKSGVQTPYNADFVTALKRRVPSAHWTGKTWLFDEASRPDVEALVAEFYPTGLQTVRITWPALDRDKPQIDGVDLATINRDLWGWKRNCSIEFRVISESVESGGSGRYPGLFGELVIEAKIRPGANISPTPESVEVIEDAQPEAAPEIENPLAQFSDQDLIAELRGRGYEVGATKSAQPNMFGGLEIAGVK